MSISIIAFLALKTGVACPDAFYSTAMHAREGGVADVSDIEVYKGQLYNLAVVSCKTSNPDALWQMVYTESNFSFNIVNLQYNGMKLSGDKAVAFAKTMARNKATAKSLNVELGPLQINWKKMGSHATDFEPIDFLDSLKSVRYLASPWVREKMKGCGEEEWTKCYYKVVRPTAAHLFSLQIDSAGQKLTETVKSLLKSKNIQREMVGGSEDANIVAFIQADEPNENGPANTTATTLNATRDSERSADAPPPPQQTIVSKPVPPAEPRPASNASGNELSTVSSLAEFQSQYATPQEDLSSVAAVPRSQSKATNKARQKAPKANTGSRKEEAAHVLKQPGNKATSVEPEKSPTLVSPQRSAIEAKPELSTLGEKVPSSVSSAVPESSPAIPVNAIQEGKTHSQSLASMVNQSSEHPVFFSDPLTPFGGKSVSNPLLQFLKPAMQSRETNIKTGESLSQNPEFKKEAKKALRDLKDMPTAKCLFCLNDDCTETKPGKPARTSAGDHICMETDAPLSILQGLKDQWMGEK